MKRILALKAVGDILLIHVGYLIAFYIQFLLKGEIDAHNLSAYLNVAPWLTVAAIVVFYGYGFYHSSSVRQQWDEILSATICALALLFLITFSLSYMLYQFGFPRRTIAIATFIQFLLILGWRALIVRWSKKYIEPIKLLIVGPAERALERAGHFAKDESGNYQVLAILVDRNGEDFALPVYESYEKLPQVLDEVRPNSILFCSDIPYQARMEMMMEGISRGVDIFIVPDLYEIMIAKSRLKQFKSVPTFRLTGLAHGRDQL